MSVLILLSGLPGTGKTSFATAIAKRLEVVHIESDAIRRGMAPQPRYTYAESARVFSAVGRRAAAAIKSGRHALVDATNLAAHDREPFVRVARRAGCRLIAVRVTAPALTVRTRLSGPRRGYSQAGPEVYELMEWREESMNCEHLVVDTRFPLAPSVELVAGLAEGE